MTWKATRRQRWEDLNVEQVVRQIGDDLDLLNAELDEHVEEDMAAHRSAAEAFQSWKEASLKSQNRTAWMVILALLAALSGIIVPLLTQR